jgi:hypothetical protein
MPFGYIISSLVLHFLTWPEIPHGHTTDIKMIMGNRMGNNADLSYS